MKLAFTFSHSKFLPCVVSVAGVAVLISSVTYLVASQLGVDASPLASKQLVVIDTDPGVDDAVALLTVLGDPGVNVIGVTCVRGNTNVPNVVINALKILTLANTYEVPVYTGNNFGLLVSPDTDDYFGTDGLADVPFTDPPSPSQAQDEHAAVFLARIVKEYPGEITVIALGPLTNIALALELNPDFLKQLKRLIISGGSVKGNGNAAPGVEFNFYMDPDSAALVLDRASISNLTVTIVPLETVKENGLEEEWRWNTLANINNSVVSFLNLIEKKVEVWHPSASYFPFDSFAVSTILNPEFVTNSQDVYCFVENRSSRLQGALAVDYDNITQNSANVELVMEVDKTVLKQLLVSNLSNFK